MMELFNRLTEMHTIKANYLMMILNGMQHFHSLQFAILQTVLHHLSLSLLIVSNSHGLWDNFTDDLSWEFLQQKQFIYNDFVIKYYKEICNCTLINIGKRILDIVDDRLSIVWSSILSQLHVNDYQQNM